MFPTEKMSCFKVMFLLNVCMQISEGLIWSPISISTSSCEEGNIVMAWGYTLESGESVSLIQWKKDNGAGGTINLANDFGGSFNQIGVYNGRLTRIGDAGLSIRNATSSDRGIYYVFASLNTSITHNTTANISIYPISNASCIPSCDSSDTNPKCDIPEACPVKSSIQAVWNVAGVKHISQFTCSSNNYGKTYMVCAEGDAITACNMDQTWCDKRTCKGELCKPDGPLFITIDIFIIISYTIMVILIIDLIIWNKNSTVSIFKSCVKTGHRCLRILYFVLLITVVVCEIGIIVMAIIGRQCENILIVGLCLGLFIITVSCIFLIVFIKTEVIIRRKDTLRNPKINTDVTITVSLRQIFISNFEWIGPKGNTLNTEVNTEERHIIVEHNSDTGETSLTIKNVSQEDNGSYFCQARNGFKIANDSIHILCGDIENKTRNMGSSAAVSREHVQFHMERKGVKSDEEERTPAIHVGTQNKVESMRLQSLPPMGGVVENKPRPQPPRPENIDAKDRNLRGLSANYDDTQGLPTGTPRPNRLTPLTPKQATVQEEDASEEPKKKKKKKKKKGQMNEENQEEEMEELRNQRTSSEDK